MISLRHLLRLSIQRKAPNSLAWAVWFSLLSHFEVWLFVILWSVALQALLSLRFFRQEYWSRLLCLPPGDLPHPGFKSNSFMYPAFFQFSSVAQSCPTLWDSIDCSTPGLPVHHQLPELKLMSIESVCHPTISSSVIPSSSCPQSFPASGSFPMSQFFVWGGQSTGVSASASVLPMNIQDWFSLGWTGWISLQSKGLWRVFSNACFL